MESIALLFVIGVLIVIGGSWLAPRIRMAAPVLLVLVGVACSYIPGMEPIEIEPEWILVVVLPPILYAAAVNVPVTDFRRNIRAISGLSVVLVIVSALGIGFLLSWLLPGLPLAAAIALGAVVAPPDAVAATSIGKRLGLPERLVTVLEGEGLVNDATALVLLRSAIAAVGGSVTLWEVAGDFAYAVVVAIAVGLVVGLVTVWARSRIGQPTLTTAISFTVPFLAFWPADAIHASGVLSVVVAGLVTGYKSARHLSAQDRISERMNWRTIQLLLENGVFLVMGFQFSHIIEVVEEDHLSVWGAVGLGLLVTLALLIMRGLFMIPLVLSLRAQQRGAQRRIDRVDAFLERADAFEGTLAPEREARLATFRDRVGRRRGEWEALASEGLGWRGSAVLTWSGMRGVVTLAAAQTLPADIPFRPQLILIAFTVAITTLVVYGSTLPLIIRLLKVFGTDQNTREGEIRDLVQVIVDAGAAELRNPELVRADGGVYDPDEIAVVVENRARLAHNYWELRQSNPSDRVAQSAALFRIMVEAEHIALIDARASGNYSASAIEVAQMVIDTDLARMNQGGSIG